MIFCRQLVAYSIVLTLLVAPPFVFPEFSSAQVPSTVVQTQVELVTFSKLDIDISTRDGVTASSCFSVTKEGLYHLELRYQKLPKNSADIMVFEGAFDVATKNKFFKLVAGVRSQQLSRISRAVPPRNPSKIQSGRLRIRYPADEELIGYDLWARKNEMPEQSESQTQITQERIEHSLSPLMPFEDKAKAKQVRFPGIDRLGCALYPGVPGEDSNGADPLVDPGNLHPR